MCLGCDYLSTLTDNEESHFFNLTNACMVPHMLKLLLGTFSAMKIFLFKKISRVRNQL
jgi:hypothetical protein